MMLGLGEGQTLVGALENIIHAKWTSHVENGQTLIRSSEAGGSTELTFERGLTPTELLNLAERALEYLMSLPPDQRNNPPIDVLHVRRIVPTFAKAIP